MQISYYTITLSQTQPTHPLIIVTYILANPNVFNSILMERICGLGALGRGES